MFGWGPYLQEQHGEENVWVRPSEALPILSDVKVALNTEPQFLALWHSNLEGIRTQAVWI